MNLFELKNEHERLLVQAIDLATGEVRDPLALKLFEESEIALEQKAIAYGVVIKSLEAQAVAIGEVLEPLLSRRSALVHEADRMRDCLRELGAEFKAVDPRTTVTVREGVVMAEVVNESVIPKSFFEVRRLLRKGDLFAALKAGQKVRGARLGRGKRVVTIR